MSAETLKKIYDCFTNAAGKDYAISLDVSVERFTIDTKPKHNAIRFSQTVNFSYDYEDGYGACEDVETVKELSSPFNIFEFTYTLGSFLGSSCSADICKSVEHREVTGAFYPVRSSFAGLREFIVEKKYVGNDEHFYGCFYEDLSNIMTENGKNFEEGVEKGFVIKGDNALMVACSLFEKAIKEYESKTNN